MCNCKNKNKASGTTGTFVVRLSGGLEIKKSTEADAARFAAKHPGAKVIKK